MTFQPCLYFRVFVRPIVVHDQMQRDIAGELGIESPQEFQKLLMPVSLMALANDLALQCLQSSEQSRCAVAFVIMGQCAATSRF